MLTLERLRYFIEAATLEHVGKAAKNVHVSPSVISSAILALEEEFKCKFFIRENNRLKLNDQGHLFLEKAKALLESSQSLYTELSAENQLMKGHYKLGGSHFLLNELVVPAFLSLRKDHPELSAEFLSMDTGMAISQILSGSLDAALVFRSALQYDLEEHVLHEGQFFIAVKKNHEILAASKSKKIDLLNELAAITFKPTTGPNFVESHPVFKNYGITPRHTFFYSDEQTVMQLLDKTNGWAFLPEMMIEKHKNKIEKVFISKDWQAPVKVSLIRNKNKTSSRLVTNLKMELAKRF